MRPVPPSIDKRNKVQLSLDESIRAVHKEFGNSLRGYILIAYQDDDIDQPMVRIHADITREDLPEYSEAVIAWALEQDEQATSQ